MDSSRLSNRSHSKSPSNLSRSGANFNQNLGTGFNGTYQNGDRSYLQNNRTYSPNRTSYQQNNVQFRQGENNVLFRQGENNGQFRQGENWNNGNRSPYRYYQKNGNGNGNGNQFNRQNWNGTVGTYNWPNWQSDIKGVYNNSTNAEIFMQNRNQQLSNQQTRDIIRDRPLINLILLLREQVEMMHQSFERNNIFCGDDVMEQENRVDYFCQRNGVNFYCNNNWNNWEENQLNGNNNNNGLFRRNFIEMTLPYSETGFGRSTSPFKGGNGQNNRYGDSTVIAKFNNDHAHNWENFQNQGTLENGRQYLGEFSNNVNYNNSRLLSKGEGFYGNGNSGVLNRLGNAFNQ